MAIHKSLLNSFIKVTEKAAIGASLHKGKNDKVAADQAAVDAMRTELNKISMNGKIVIGEGELDEAPMLYINEKVGNKHGPELDIAVDPLEGTNFTAKNLPNAFSVLAVAKRGDLLNAPDMYMEKIAVGKNLPENIIDLDFNVEKNIKLLAEAKNVKISNLTACLLKRPRHKKIIKSLSDLNVKIVYLDDGDVSGAMSVYDSSNKIDIFLGIGGAPEGVLAAAALKCLNCQMQTRLVFNDLNEKNKAKKLGIKDFDKKYYINDMVKGDVIFCATGVTNGDLVSGITDDEKYFYSETLALHKSSNINKIFKNKLKK